MAGQFHVARSEIVIGAAIVAAGPFACAESSAAETFPYFPSAIVYNLTQAQDGCMANKLSNFGVLDSKRLLNIAWSLAEAGKIDPLSGLKRSKVYFYSGKDDHTVVGAVVEAARDFYLAAGVPSENIAFVTGAGGHAFLTPKPGAACDRSDPPYVNNCNYDQAEAILRFIYGTLEPKADAKADSFVTFDQSLYASRSATLAPEGVVYVPSVCRLEENCRVHVVFHGCKQSRADVGDALINGSGFADWAEANKIIVLFPQTEASELNPYSCWDWWGYTGLDYLSKNSPQIKAVSAMLSRLAERPSR
jgi:hypothetical protein